MGALEVRSSAQQGGVWLRLAATRAEVPTYSPARGQQGRPRPRLLLTPSPRSPPPPCPPARGGAVDAAA